MYELAEQMINYTNFLVALFIFPISTIYYWIKTLFVLKKWDKKTNPLKLYLINLFIAYSLMLLLFAIQLKFKEGFGLILFYSSVLYFLTSTLIIGIYEYKNSNKNVSQSEESDIEDIEDIDFFELIKERLEPSLQEKKLFLNPKFTLRDCAKSIGTNEKYLSSYLNKFHKMNFNTFINKYRIEQAKKLLHSTDSDKYTIEAIAQMSGFNSKSSFNSVFKKHTGLTPSEFKLKK
jgi:AraC-like DNA-binding protein